MYCVFFCYRWFSPPFVAEPYFSDAKKCRNDKEAEIRELRRDNSEIDETRSRLEDISRTHIKSLDDSIPVLSEFWASTRDDAFKIKQWLSTGAKVAVSQPPVTEVTSELPIYSEQTEIHEPEQAHQ